MKNIKIDGLSQLKRTLNGITLEYADKSAGVLSVMIAGISKDFIPVDSRTMLKNTYAAKKGGKYYLISNTGYAADQYNKELFHLHRGGRYMSITKSTQVPPTTKEELKGKFGANKRSYLYRRNYEYLKSHGLLSKRKAQWFHMAARIALEPSVNGLRKSFTEVARKRAKAGKFYKR